MVCGTGWPYLPRSSQTERALGVSEGAGPERQAAEDSAEDAVSWLVERVETAVLLLDAEGRIVQANRAAAILFAAESAAGLAGRAWMDLVVGPERLRCLSGEEFAADVTRQRLDYAGQMGWGLVVRDLDAVALRSRQTLRAARLAVIGEIAPALVHDLAQPLNVIRLGAEAAVLLAERGADDPVSAQQRFEQIAGQCAEAASLMESLSRICRREKAAAAPFDAIAAVRTAALLRHAALRDHGIALDLASLDATTGPALVVGRRGDLEQIILALLVDVDHAFGRSHPGHVQCVIRRDSRFLLIELTDDRPALSADAEDDLSVRAAAAAVTAGLGGELTFCRGTAGGGRVVIRLPLSLALAHLLLIGDRFRQEAADYAGARVSYAEAVTAWDSFRADPADVVLIDEAAGVEATLVAQLRDFDPWLPILFVAAAGTPEPDWLATFGDERCRLWRDESGSEALLRLIGDFLAPPA